MNIYRKTVKRHDNPEFRLQCMVAQYLDLHPKHPLYCASAGGMRVSIGTAVKMKKVGYKKGFPDLFIYEPLREPNIVGGINYCGLALELKSDKGTLSPEQISWGKELEGRFYKWAVCYSFDEAVKIIDNYLGRC